MLVGTRGQKDRQKSRHERDLNKRRGHRLISAVAGCRKAMHAAGREHWGKMTMRKTTAEMPVLPSARRKVKKILYIYMYMLLYIYIHIYMYSIFFTLGIMDLPFCCLKSEIESCDYHQYGLDLHALENDDASEIASLKAIMTTLSNHHVSHASMLSNDTIL